MWLNDIYEVLESFIFRVRQSDYILRRAILVPDQFLGSTWPVPDQSLMLFDRFLVVYWPVPDQFIFKP